ncbi:hypothetical protein MRS44_011167 [Fusarium solani]|uniref:uncharacterized protein n=1 Tax=Fusarium solani TaxID=169388 RepID=UPI0032C3FC51|nr:hypothetical protein MRS44_011167 [Fusarium solani]
MKFSISLVALFATGILASPAPKPAQKCPADRVWSDCGSACPETCTSSPDRVCITLCVLDASARRAGTCVPKSKC